MSCRHVVFVRRRHLRGPGYYLARYPDHRAIHPLEVALEDKPVQYSTVRIATEPGPARL